MINNKTFAKTNLRFFVLNKDKTKLNITALAQTVKNVNPVTPKIGATP